MTYRYLQIMGVDDPTAAALRVGAPPHLSRCCVITQWEAGYGRRGGRRIVARYQLGGDAIETALLRLLEDVSPGHAAECRSHPVTDAGLWLRRWLAEEQAKAIGAERWVDSGAAAWVRQVESRGAPSLPSPTYSIPGVGRGPSHPLDQPLRQSWFLLAPRILAALWAVAVEVAVAPPPPPRSKPSCGRARRGGSDE